MRLIFSVAALISRLQPSIYDSFGVASLELHKIYRVLPDTDAARDGDLRVVDESGEDYLYPGSRFLKIELPKAIEQVLLRAS